MAKSTLRSGSARAESKKLHIEIMPANWKAIENHIEAYNANPLRSTPVLKYADVINRAIDEFFTAKENENRGSDGDEKESDNEIR